MGNRNFIPGFYLLRNRTFFDCFDRFAPANSSRPSHERGFMKRMTREKGKLNIQGRSLKIGSYLGMPTSSLKKGRSGCSSWDQSFRKQEDRDVIHGGH